MDARQFARVRYRIIARPNESEFGLESSDSTVSRLRVPPTDLTWTQHAGFVVRVSGIFVCTLQITGLFDTTVHCRTCTLLLSEIVAKLT